MPPPKVDNLSVIGKRGLAEGDWERPSTVGLSQGRGGGDKVVFPGTGPCPSILPTFVRYSQPPRGAAGGEVGAAFM